MFDAPDFGPLCLAPWIGLLAGILAFVVLKLLTRKFPKNGWITPLLFSSVVCFIVAFISLYLGIGELDPTPWVMPSPEDVVGIWHLDPHFVDVLKDEGYTVPPHSIEFKEDGTFEMRNVPNLWITLAKADPDDETEFNAEGTWTIADESSSYSNDPIYVVFLHYEYLSLKDVDLVETPVYADGKIPLFFRGYLSPYSLDAIGYNTYNPFMRFVRK